MKYNVGDEVAMVEPSTVLDLRRGDRGVIVNTPMYVGDSLSVHFYKWDRVYDRNWRDGISPHKVNGVEAFYLSPRDVKPVPSCMFKP